jgi:uncharacterized protein YceK
MMRNTLSMALCILALSLQGCASIGARTDTESGSPRYIYPGVQRDYEGLAHADVPPASLVCFFDLPFSFAVDTVLLPVDVAIVAVSGKGRSGQARTE